MTDIVTPVMQPDHPFPYPVYIGSEGLGSIVTRIKFIGSARLFAAVDANVADLYSEELTSLCNTLGIIQNPFILPPGESAKDIEVILEMWRYLHGVNANRDDALVIIGGGASGDAAGFAASVFKRGMQIIHIPTTLISMVDSSIGGKTAINFNNIKNTVGTFTRPKAVFILPAFLSTLPDDHYYSGIGEVMKYALIGHEDLYRKLLSALPGLIQKDPDVLTDVIAECVRFKAEVVANDENDTGIRRILNYGHTFGHAFEMLSKSGMTHGAAVVLGMKAVIFTASKLGIAVKDTELRAEKILGFFPEQYLQDTFDPGEVVEVMKQDKKNESNRITLMLLQEIGLPLVRREFSAKQIKQILSEFLSI